MDTPQLINCSVCFSTVTEIIKKLGKGLFRGKKTGMDILQKQQQQQFNGPDAWSDFKKVVDGLSTNTHYLIQFSISGHSFIFELINNNIRFLQSFGGRFTLHDWITERQVEEIKTDRLSKLDMSYDPKKFYETRERFGLAQWVSKDLIYEYFDNLYRELTIENNHENIENAFIDIFGVRLPLDENKQNDYDTLKKGFTAVIYKVIH